MIVLFADRIAVAAPPITGNWAMYGLTINGLGNLTSTDAPAATDFLEPPESSFLRFPVVVEKAGPGPWRLEIWNTETERQVDEAKFDLAQEAAAPLTLWTKEIPSSNLRFDFHGNLTDTVIKIPNYLYGVENIQIENVIGSPDFKYVLPSDAGSEIYELARPVVRLKFADPKGYVPCTGFLVSPDLIMTNEHCFEDGVTGIFADFFYEKDGPEPVEKSVFIKPEVIDPFGFDFVVLRLKEKIPNDFAKPLTLTAAAIGAKTKFVIVQHPNNEVKQYVADNCSFLPGGGPMIFNHTCDTKGGSSGSPMLVPDGSGNVIALHQTGTGEGAENGNSAIDMERILFKIKEGAVLAKRDAWARIAGCMREEAGSVVGSVIV